jgi:3-deoxy-D-manno-octulosonate 8-phosphate phosphatase (KDO 8-P phosphatase)
MPWERKVETAENSFVAVIVLKLKGFPNFRAKLDAPYNIRCPRTLQSVKEILEKYPKPLIKKASQIKALIFDVDGVLTDGKIIYDDSGKEIKAFNVKDGLIVAHLRRAGIIVGAISGRESNAVGKRAAELKLDFCHQGIVDKASVFVKLIEYHSLKKKQVAYIGDDINDLTILRQVGLAASPADAPVYVRKSVEVVTSAKGGNGVMREVADLILASQGYFDKMLRSL